MPLKSIGRRNVDAETGSWRWRHWRLVCVMGISSRLTCKSDLSKILRSKLSAQQASASEKDRKRGVTIGHHRLSPTRGGGGGGCGGADGLG